MKIAIICFPCLYPRRVNNNTNMPNSGQTNFFSSSSPGESKPLSLPISHAGAGFRHEINQLLSPNNAYEEDIKGIKKQYSKLDEEQRRHLKDVYKNLGCLEKCLAKQASRDFLEKNKVTKNSKFMRIAMGKYNGNQAREKLSPKSQEIINIPDKTKNILKKLFRSIRNEPVSKSLNKVRFLITELNDEFILKA